MCNWSPNIYLTNTWVESQISPMMQNPLCSVSMQTNQNYHHLAPRKATLSLLDVQICLLAYEMGLVLEVVVWLGGFQL